MSLFQKLEMKKPQSAISEMHKDVSVRRSKERKRQVDAHNEKKILRKSNLSRVILFWFDEVIIRAINFPPSGMALLELYLSNQIMCSNVKTF